MVDETAENRIVLLVEFSKSKIVFMKNISEREEYLVDEKQVLVSSWWRKWKNPPLFTQDTFIINWTRSNYKKSFFSGQRTLFIYFRGDWHPLFHWYENSYHFKSIRLNKRNEVKHDIFINFINQENPNTNIMITVCNSPQVLIRCFRQTILFYLRKKLHILKKTCSTRWRNHFFELPAPISSFMRFRPFLP